MKFASLQDYFDQAVAFFATMPNQSVKLLSDTEVRSDGPKDYCVYYNIETQDACIIGQFIPDEYRLDVAEYAGTVRELLQDHNELASHIIYDGESVFTELGNVNMAHWGFALAAALQVVHDSKRNWDSDGFIGWEALETLAADFELSFKPARLIAEKIATKA